MKVSIRSVVLGLLIILGLGFIVYFGVQPRPIAKIKLSEFTGPEQAAQAALLRLRQELQNNSILLIGLETQNTEIENIILSLIEKQQNDPQLQRQFVLLDSELENATSFFGGIQAERVSTKNDFSRFLQAMQKAQAEKTRVLVLMPAVYAAGLLKDSPADLLRQNKIEYMSLILMGLSRSREKELHTTIPCRVADHDLEGSGDLGCMALQLARNNYRKKMQAGSLVGLMSQVSATDFLFLLARE